MPLNLPEPNRETLTRSQLDLVVCQVRFEINLNVSEPAVALAFHKSLGGKAGDFPEIQPLTGQAVQVTVGPDVSPLTEARTSAGWRYASHDGSSYVSLMPDFMSLETTRYESWEGNFRPRLANVLEALAEHVRPSIEQRVGLRYIDRIKDLALSSPTDWEPYVAPELLGLVRHEALGSTVRLAQQQLLLDLSDGVLCNLRHGLLSDAQIPSPVDYLLDYDIYRMAGQEFVAVDILDAADQFNTLALQLFQASVTPALLEHLRH